MNKKIIGILICTILLLTTTNLVAQKNIKNETITILSEDEWFLDQKLLTSDGEADDWFGFSIDIDGDYAIIGARWDDVNSIINAGSAYIFKYDGTRWNEEAKIYAPDGEEGDWFGHAVSISGDYVFVSAASDETNGKASGSIYVFKRDGTSWNQEQKITVDPSGGDSTIDFGWSIDMLGDYALVGAINDNDLGDSSGSVYVFKNDGASWNLEGKLLPADGKAWAYFGYCISIYEDSALIGARCDNYIGAAYIFKLESGSWVESQKLVPPDGTNGDYFGRAVNMDEEYLIVGSNCDDDNGEDSGSAYIYKFDGYVWIYHDKIIALDGAPEEEFGGAVSINQDYALIGVKFDSDNGMYSGSAYIFQRDGEDWNQQVKIKPIDGEFWEHFGNAVYLNSNEEAFICSQYDGDNGQYSGSVYIYKQNITIPDLDCTGSLSWEDIEPNATVTGSFTVENVGEANSELDWHIESYPDWGTWTFDPEGGDDLLAGDSLSIDVEIQAPNEEETEFTGEIKIINIEDPTDFCIIDVVLKTPVIQIYQFPFLQLLLEKFPNILPILRYIFGL